MIQLRRDAERRHDRHRKREIWLTFHSDDPADPLAEGFGSLQTLSEGRLAPGATLPRQPHRDADVITYVREGVLAYEEAMGTIGDIRAGEFQRLTVGVDPPQGQSRFSRADWAHVFQIWLGPTVTQQEPNQELKRFSVAERRGTLCLVASLDARQGSLRIRQDASIYSAILDPGRHVVHELTPGRSAWLHIVHGAIALGALVLSSGDGAGVTAERAVSFTAREKTELLLLDLRAEAPTSVPDGAAP